MRGAALLLFVAASASASDLSLLDALRRAEAASPDIRAAIAREEQARSAESARQAALYPALELHAIHSGGFIGSNGALWLAGLPGSPFRTGPTAALVGRLDLFDARNIRGVTVSSRQLRAAQARTALVRYRVDLAAANAFLDCARQRGARELWIELAEEMREVSAAVQRLVRAGQHSPVERLLVEDQVLDAEASAAIFGVRYEGARRRLAALIGAGADEFSSPPAWSLSEADAAMTPGNNPLEDVAEAELAAAEAGVLERRAFRFPRLTAVGSVGAMEGARLVERKNYSGGLGIVFPLFEGFRQSAEIERAQRFTEERRQERASVRLMIDLEHSRWDEQLETSRVRLAALQRQLSQAREALVLAKRRYLSFQGPLVDVREALRNLARIRSQQNEASADLVLAAAANQLLLGGVP